MAKAPTKAPSAEVTAPSAEEEAQTVFAAPKVDESLPGIFKEATLTWGANPDYWPIWLKNEYHAWKAGGPAPTGDLSEVLGKKKAEKE